MALQNDARFLPDLFERLKATGPGDEGWQDQVAFLQELTGLAKHLQQGHRQQLLSKLASMGLFEARPLLFPLSSAILWPFEAAQARQRCDMLKGYPRRLCFPDV